MLLKAYIGMNFSKNPIEYWNFREYDSLENQFHNSSINVFLVGLLNVHGKILSPHWLSFSINSQLRSSKVFGMHSRICIPQNMQVVYSWLLWCISSHALQFQCKYTSTAHAFSIIHHTHRDQFIQKYIFN